MRSLIKKVFFVVLSLSVQMATYAQEPNNVYLTASDCVDALNGVGTATLYGNVDSIIGWIGRGDVSVGWNPGQKNVTFFSTGYGKGCITVKYMATGSNSCSCASSTSIDVYKTFSLPDSIGIEGPTCVSPGQTVVYSIDPVVTRNINDRIGIDSYYWNVDTLEGKSNSFVESVHYASGDSSSVTFRVKDWDDNIGPNEISVIVGKCNINNASAKRTLSLMKQAPKPDFGFDHLCIPYGETPFTLTILNASSNVEYTWAKSPDWEFLEFNADSTSVTVRPNADSPDTISVSAVYKNNKGMECATTKTVLQIYRLWGNTANISGQQCTSVNGGPYRYSITGNIPRSTQVRWKFPTTWTVTSKEMTNQYIDAYPTSSASLTDTIKVYELSQCESSESRFITYPVNVKPASVNITGMQCVDAGHTYTYHINRLPGAIGPNAQQYALYINGYFQNNFVVDTINITIADTTRFIQVQPLGNNGCNGNLSDTWKVMISLSDPTGISKDTTACISAGMSGVISLEIEGASSLQNYTWLLDKTHNWQIAEYLNTNHSKVSVQTTGVAGKDTIAVYTAGAGLCGNTDTVQIILETPAVPYSILIEERTRYYDFYSNPEDLNTLQEFENDTLYYTWAINGVSRDEDYVGYDADELSVRKSTLSESDIVSLMVETKSGCRYFYSTRIGDAIIPESVNNPMYIPRKAEVSDIESNSDLMISPNPANSQILITLPKVSEHSIIKICDMSGKMLMRKTTSESSLTISTGSLPDALYTMLLYQDGKIMSKQFIIKH